MTAPRLDLGELRAKCDNAEDSWSVIDIECSDLEHLLGIAGAALDVCEARDVGSVSAQEIALESLHRKVAVLKQYRGVTTSD